LDDVKNRLKLHKNKTNPTEETIDFEERMQRLREQEEQKKRDAKEKKKEKKKKKKEEENQKVSSPTSNPQGEENKDEPTTPVQDPEVDAMSQFGLPVGFGTSKK
jgi:hypothetical protein